MSEGLRRFIGWWQLACGLAGLCMLVLMYFDVPPNGRAWIEQYGGWINFYVGCAYFSLATHAGYRLLCNLPGAIGLALACEAAQVASFAFLSGPHVQIGAGPVLGMRISSYQIGFTVGFNSSFFIGTRIEGPAFEVVINFLALAWTITLLRAWINEEKDRPIPA